MDGPHTHMGQMLNDQVLSQYLVKSKSKYSPIMEETSRMQGSLKFHFCFNYFKNILFSI